MDLDVDVRLSVFGVARVTDEADQLAGVDAYTWGDAWPESPLAARATVVGAGRIVVEVVEVVLVPVGVAYDDADAGGGVIEEADHDAVHR